ncbi:MAG TPA: hypothetical protein VG370_34730 [Chloroflexota bacterium]|jgi:hypothetical protein|nr:hypothetical protein [Chloroflexota bacterium]
MATGHASGPIYCQRHAGVATGLRCDDCGRPFCRECLVSRFITSRSTVWLCRRCAAGWSGTGSWGVGSTAWRGSLGDLVGRYWWALAALGLLVLYSGSHAGRLPGV